MKNAEKLFDYNEGTAALHLVYEDAEILQNHNPYHIAEKLGITFNEFKEMAIKHGGYQVMAGLFFYKKEDALATIEALKNRTCA